MCCFCKTMFISQQFLFKHQTKCVHMKLHFILKMKLQLRRKNLNEYKSELTKDKNGLNENENSLIKDEKALNEDETKLNEGIFF